jgi:hypothetical protein
MAAKIAAYLPISADINYIIARILRQIKANEYRMIDSKVMAIEVRLITHSPMNFKVYGLSASPN